MWRWPPNPCSLSLGTSPHRHRDGPYGITLLGKLSCIVKADWMSGGPRLKQSNLLFPECRIRILRCRPDSDAKLGLRQKQRRLVCRKGKMECRRYADRGRNERPHHPRVAEKQTLSLIALSLIRPVSGLIPCKSTLFCYYEMPFWILKIIYLGYCVLENLKL